MKQAAQKQPSETASPITLNGVFTGWADNHTIEVVVESVPTAFMVEDEVVKETLASFEDGAGRRGSENHLHRSGIGVYSKSMAEKWRGNAPPFFSFMSCPAF